LISPNCPPPAAQDIEQFHRDVEERAGIDRPLLQLAPPFPREHVATGFVFHFG
jgi:hypothetical protein